MSNVLKTSWILIMAAILIMADNGPGCDILPLVPLMPGRVNQFDQAAAMTKVIEIAPHAIALKSHVEQIIESHAFRGSHRSQEFLRFIIDRALDHQFDQLKERVLGVELFGRPPSYDTGDDSIVRVTARDVRKRLSQFYAEATIDSSFQIQLPPGSYIPEFRNITKGGPSEEENVGKVSTASIAELPGPVTRTLLVSCI